MPVAAFPPFVLGELPGAGSSAALLLGGALLALAGFCAWQWRRSEQLRFDERAAQARLLAATREEVSALRHDKEAVAGESQAKSEMLATLSRETRAHLNGIIGSADLMLDARLTPSSREHLSTLRASAESMLQTLNDVLDYASVETGQIRITQSNFDLRQPLIEVVEVLSPLALLKKLDLVLILAPDVPARVTGDVVRLRQVLLNLVSSAVRSTARGRVVLRVGLPPADAVEAQRGPGWLHFSITDTGPGIPEAMRETLFDRLTAAQAASARNAGGSGLDLAISKRLVELMGGQIGARNLPETGSEFWVFLPLPADPLTEPAHHPALRDFHVVVLDELAAARVAAATLLARLGIEHDVTDNVAEAVGLLRDTLEDEEECARVLLLDEHLARTHAAELSAGLASDPGPNPPRIVLLSRDPAAVPLADLALPVVVVLRKPLLRAELLLEAMSQQSVPVLLESRPGRTAPPSTERSVPPFPVPAAAAAGTRVLVIDDDEISRSVSSQLLERLGCAVDRAPGALDALVRLRETRYDLVFMDCQMPIMDGFEATTRILEEYGKNAPPIVALTANTSLKDRERCFATGMSDFVDKPVRRAELVRVLNRWIPGRAAR